MMLLQIPRKKYEEVCGSIDAEISVPELVATGDFEAVTINVPAFGVIK